MDIHGISNYKLQQYSCVYAIKIAAKGNETLKKSGENLIKLLNSSIKISSNKIDLYA
ncbi:MAG: hypothetical protein PWQ25_730 [Deferribacteres bacterium]|jgi:hypothetical protein|nr:hypothetical protein [Deferribacteraceae bacterium]MDK2791867.1 hypothetical protein [Deferribacteres bacterium]